jgi:peptidoglycan/LPS O-acetylase OafA/YrhL
VAVSNLDKQNSKFELDNIRAIDGLRGVAVLLVVYYHYFEGGQNIGFIGVDVFFIISGFVITRLILEELSSKTFSLKKFLRKRWQRLAPAYLALLFATCTLSIFILLPTDLNNLSNGLFLNILSLQNFYFQSNTGYFDNNLRTSPLLHTWSLAVEAQFYFVFPIMMLILRSRRKQTVLLFMMLFFCSSAYISFAFGQTFPAANFYLLPFRAFELLAGSILAILRGMKPIQDFWFRITWKMREIFSALAIFCSLISISLVKISMSWPNYTVFPLIISFLALLFSSEQSPARILFGNKMLAQIGKMSYSIYLIHFPILKLFENFWLTNLTIYSKTILITATFVLSYASYRFVELPFRRHVAWRSTRNLSIVTIAIVCMFSLGISNVQGFVLPKFNRDQIAFIEFYTRSENTKGYLNNSQAIYGNGDCHLEEENSSRLVSQLSNISRGCVLKSTEDVDSRTYILWGDSHAFALAPGIMSYMGPSDNLIALTRNGCRASVEPELELSCLQHNSRVIRLLESIRPANIVISTVNELQLQEMQDVLHRIVNLNHKILLVGPAPSYIAPFSEIFASKLWESNQIFNEIGIDWQKLRENERSIMVMERLADSNHDVEFINLYSLFCRDRSCQFRSDKSSQEIFTWDASHLTIRGAKHVAPYILEIFDNPNKFLN